jgi:hypothetical protein
MDGIVPSALVEFTMKERNCATKERPLDAGGMQKETLFRYLTSERKTVLA